MGVQQGQSIAGLLRLPNSNITGQIKPVFKIVTT